MSRLVKLSIKNKSSINSNSEFQVAEAAVPTILAWYGAYHSGDNYTAKINGVKLALDHNGELVT